MGRNVVAAGWGVVARLGAVSCCCVFLAHCGGSFPGKVDPRYGVSSSPRLVAFGQPVPKGGGYYRLGKPYVVAGQTYIPEENPHYSAVGLASWYGADFHGRQTANGEIFDMTSLSAAHPTLPIPSYVRVTNLANQRSVIVRVNDRGPYHSNRLIDVSVRTAKLLGFYDEGVAQVQVDYVGRASLNGSDDAKLAATLRSGTPAPGPSQVRLASARPFMPRRAGETGTVPLPTDRPYELGDASAQPAGSVATVTASQTPPPSTHIKVATAATATVARLPSARSAEPTFAARFASARDLVQEPPSGTPSRVSAFAAPDEQGGALLSGRGLY